MKKAFKVISRTALIAVFGIILSLFYITEAKAEPATFTVTITTNKDEIAVYGHEIESISFEVTAINPYMNYTLGRGGWKKGSNYVYGNFETGEYYFAINLSMASCDYSDTENYILMVDGIEYREHQVVDEGIGEIQLVYYIPVTIVAPTTYNITFDANGGTVSPTSGTTDASDKLSSLPTPTWSGHSFSGWFTEANGGTQVTTNTVFSGDDTIYAHWTEPQESSQTDYLDELRDKIKAAIALGGKQTIYWDQGTALPYDVMKLLEDNPDITLVFSYTYLGKDYKVTIPGAYVKTNILIPWYGPLYLYGNFGFGVPATTAVQPINPTTGTYTVVPGDTLSAISQRFNTTVRHLVDTNNIANPDFIRPGQVFNY